MLACSGLWLESYNNKMNILYRLKIYPSIKHSFRAFGFMLFAFTLCCPLFLHTATMPVYADNGVWDYAKYGFPKPDGNDSKKIAIQYDFDESWQKYEGPAAIKAGQALGIDPQMIGGWSYQETYNHVFLDNCDDKESDINTPCMVGDVEDYNWQIGYGFRPFDWVESGTEDINKDGVSGGGHVLVRDAVNLMHPSESAETIINNVIQQSQQRALEYNSSWPAKYRQQITNPSAAPVGITLEEILSDTYKYRQLFGILLMDDEISAYCTGFVIRYYMQAGSGMADSFRSWGGSYDKMKVSNSFNYVYKLGLPNGATLSSCTENRETELSAIFSETPFYDPDCDPSSATNGLGVSSDGFVFPQKTTKSQLQKLSANNNWMTCIFGITEMTKGAKDNPDNIGNYPGARGCHHDYLAADIFNDTGTPVLAPRPGKIVDVSESSTGAYGTRIHLYSDKALGGDGLWYYFAHCLPGSSKVRVGAVVKAGDELAQVGTSKDAEGTTPHTHFDVSPSENYFSRTADGTEGPLLDPGSALKASYAKIPEN